MPDAAPQMDLNIPDEGGLAGFGDLPVNEDIARYIAGNICRHTRSNPILAREICRLVEHHFGAHITTATVRKVSAYCIKNLSILIGTERRGYFRALKAHDLDGTIDHRTQRIRSQMAVVDVLERGQKILREQELRFEEKNLYE